MKTVLLNSLAAVRNRLRQERDRRRYARWIRDIEPERIRLLDAALPALSACTHRPRLSILVPLYNTPESYLRPMLASVQAQTYAEWELCLADDASADPRGLDLARAYAAADPRIKVCARPARGHISACSNSALALATGEFVALLDHDDELHPRALERVVQTLHTRPEADLIFTDEDKITVDGVRFEPIFKPDWNRWLMMAVNMVNHLGVYRKSVLDRIGGFREGYEGSQDYDLILRFIEAAGDRNIVHIPEVLYHWRAVPDSTAGDPSVKRYAFVAAKKAIAEHHERLGRRAVVGDSYLYILHKLYLPYDAAAHHASVIVIADSLAEAERAVGHVVAQTAYAHFDVIAGAPGASPGTDTIRGVSVTRFDTAGRTLPDACNAAASRARGPHLAFLAPSLRIRGPAWLDEMISPATQDDVGVVGGKLYGSGGRVLNAGLVLGVGEALYDCAWNGIAGSSFGHAGRARVIQEMTAVSADCLLTHAALFRDLGGFDAAHLPARYFDVDYCLRARRAGRKTVWTPFAEFTDPRHRTPPPQPRSSPELDHMRETWGDRLLHDPSYNPNFNPRNARFEW
ncbi:MAG: glycosyltransferase [Lentisphaerae bacterium]|nr:glycosyltransferase [Lentisphaerota bacterium]